MFATKSVSRIFLVFLAMISLFSAAWTTSPALADGNNQKPLAQPLLNSDGTLNLSTGYNGPLDIGQYDISLDPAHGPLFKPLMSGNNWHALGAPLSDGVYAIAVSGTDVYVGGSFEDAGGLANADYIAKWNGSSWSALGTTPLDNPVDVIVVSGTDIYVGGYFNNAGGIANADSIAKWDGAAWSALGTGLEGQVISIAVNGTTVYAGGDGIYRYTAVDGMHLDPLAKWDGSNWSALPLLNGIVSAIAFSGNDLYVGGSMMDGDGNGILKLDGTSWSVPGAGLINADVYAITVSGTDVYVGGWFENAGGIDAADYIAKWDGSAWSALGTTPLNSVVDAIAVSGTDVYVGGFFWITDIDANQIAKWDGSAWSALGTDLAASNTVSAIAVNGPDVYAAGDFQNAGGDPNADYLARFGPNVSAPTVASISRANPDPTNAASVDFTVTFSESVSGADATDFSLSTSGVTGASITGVSGSDATRTVSVNSGVGSGTIRLDLIDDDTIVNMGNIPLGGVGTGNGAFASGETYTIDKTASDTQINSQPANPANSAAATFTFSSADGTATFECSLDGSGYAACASPKNYASLAAGAHTFAVRAKDPAGNLDATPAAYTWTIDTTVPTVNSSTRANIDPTNATSVDFTVTFSESVTGVDTGDFSLTISGVTGAAVSSVSGSGATRTVNVSTGSGSGTIRLDVVDDDSILDTASNPLGGAGAGNGSFTTGEAYTTSTTATLTLNSIDTQDGWVLESSENGKAGGSLNTTATSINLGDNAKKKQYRGFLSFDTGASLPDNAVITAVTLRVKKQTQIGGGTPMTIFQGLIVDIKKGFFGSAATLQTSDFQASANLSYGPHTPSLITGWYNINLTSAILQINKLGLTQMRLRFKLDDNNNTVANYLSLFSGNAGVADRPQLVITYHLP